MRTKLYTFFIWWSVIGYSLWIGGTFFSMVVVVPMWSYDPPASVTAFFGGTNFNTTIYNFFGPPWMLMRTLPLLLLLPMATPAQRQWLFIPATCMIVMVIFTLTFVYPINTILMTQAGAGIPPDQIGTVVHKWIMADQARFVVGCIGYYFLLKVFRQP